MKSKKQIEPMERMRHSASHIMAEAVQCLFPEAKFGIGPTIEDGFYYDFELPRPLTPEDLPTIENKMREIISRNVQFVTEEISKDKARELFAAQPYKLELIDEIPDSSVTIYKQGSFTDLCRGPHLASTGEVKAFKLTHVAGAYWRGDEKRPMLQRIYGVAFESREELDDYLSRQAEATKRDHRKLGKELDLFSIHEEIGPGLICWHPRGALIRQIIEDFWRAEHIKRDYDIVYTPHIAKLDLWKTSGHWEFYRDYLFSPMEIEGQQYMLKPMNCLGHILIYKSKLRSYRNLPLRYAELGTVYRYERTGVLYGLARVRGFTQDDAHIFCRPAGDGVLVRAGHTEAIVDLARLAGLYPAGVICEIMDEDGNMARLTQLEAMASKFNLRIVTIADLIAYRLRHEKLVQRVTEAKLPTMYGEFTAVAYKSAVDTAEHIALVKGDISQLNRDEPVLVRVHSECLTGDVFGSLRCDCGVQIEMALQSIAKEERGVFLYMRQEGRGIGFHNKLCAYALQDQGLDTVEANIALGFAPDLRDYGVGAQILADLGLHNIRLLTNNPKKVIGLESYGIKIVEAVPLIAPPTSYNIRYLETKQKKLGHILGIQEGK